MRYNLTDLSRIPLSGTDLADTAIDALQLAKKADAKISDCPWNTSHDHDARYRRVVWRSVFRGTRDKMSGVFPLDPIHQPLVNIRSEHTHEISGQFTGDSVLTPQTVQQPAYDITSRNDLTSFSIGQSDDITSRNTAVSGKRLNPPVEVERISVNAHGVNFNVLCNKIAFIRNSLNIKTGVYRPFLLTYAAQFKKKTKCVLRYFSNKTRCHQKYTPITIATELYLVTAWVIIRNTITHMR